MRDNSGNAGCALIIIIICFIGLARGCYQDQVDFEHNHAMTIDKYNYNPDSLIKNISLFSSEQKETKLKQKMLLMRKDGNEFIVVHQIPLQLKDLIAYNLDDLETIVLMDNNNEELSGLGEDLVTKETISVTYYNYKTSTIIAQTTINGNHYIQQRMRKGTKTSYKTYDTDVAADILQRLEH